MQKKFFSNLVLLLVLNLLIKPIWVLGIDVQVQNRLGPEIYGNYFALLNFAFLFLVLFDFGLNNYNNRQVSRNPERMPEQLASLGTLKLLMGVVVMIIMILVGLMVGFEPEQIKLLWAVGMIIFLQSFLLFIRSNISGIQWYRKDVLISVFDRIIAIILCAVLLSGAINGFTLDIESFLGVQIFAYCLSIILAYFILRTRSKKIKFHFRLRSSFKILKGSFYFALLTFLMMGYYKVDAVMIERLLTEGNREAGIYAQSYKLLEAGLMFAYLFSTLLLPMFSRLIKEKQNLKWLISLSNQLLLLPVCVIVIGALVHRHELMTLLYNQGAYESAGPFIFLFASLIPMSASYIYATLITAKGDLKTLNIIAAGGMVFNILGNAFMIPKFGIMGASIITCLTMSLVSLCQVVIAYRNFNLHLSLRGVLKAGALIVGLLVASLMTAKVVGDWRVGLVLYSFIAFVWLRILGLFSVNQIRLLISEKEKEGIVGPT